MGRLQKKRNWKARNSAGNSDPPVFNENDVVQLDLDVKAEQYDASNALVLPSTKKKQTSLDNKDELKKKKKKPLSKKEKKRLQKILERKEKKSNRAELLEKLKEVQATSDELQHLTSTSMMQTFGLKRNSSAKMSMNCDVTKISNVKGSKRKRCQDSVQEECDPGSDVKDSESICSSDVDSDVEDTADEGTKTRQSKELTSATSSDLHGEDSFEVAPSEHQGAPDEKAVITAQLKPEIPDVQVEKMCEKKCEPAVFVPVNRSPEIQAAREKLPIYLEEQSIMEAIKENAVVVIHGATGTGKTTQVPQFLYEAGYTKNGKMIGITEPRRIAAVSMAFRVAEEMNLPDAVAYHIRYERTVADKTEIKFMTDGVLLKELRHDFLLSKYSVIIIDEAHERSIFSDVLIGLLSRILKLRQKKEVPLKLIIMSATLRLDDFLENRNLFKEQPHLLKVESRQYDVVLHFNKQTPGDYLEAAYKKVCKIHRELPLGGILVFVTGEQEVNTLCKRLKKAFPFVKRDRGSVSNSSINDDESYMEKRKRKKLKRDGASFSELPSVNLDDYSSQPVDEKHIQQLSHENESESENEEFVPEMDSESFQPLYVLPLYSILSTEEQVKIFKPPPNGARLCVVATNIAETSVTIPGLKYVVDSGKTKTKVYDPSGGVSQFVITWASKASANQRAGRAGRTEGGHCYRLYSSAVFDHDFPAFSLPDIQRTPVDDVLLQMKALGIDRVVNFPFPSAPDIEALKAAEKRLVMLGALQDLQKGQRYKDIKKWEFSAKVTPLGKAMSRFPVSPRFGKMLLLSYQHEVISHVIGLVSAFTVPELFLSSAVPAETEDCETQKKKQWIGVKKIGAGSGKSLKLGDAMVILRAIAAYSNTPNKAQFCLKYGVRQKAMVEINKMRLQLTREMNRSFKDLNVPLPTDSVTEMTPPDEEEIDKIRKVLAASLIDHVATRVPEGELGTEKRKLKNAYRCLETEEFVFIHPSSILFHEAPEFVVYQEIFQTSKYFMKGIAEIEPEWIPLIAPNMCELSAPLETPAPCYEESIDKILCGMTSTFGRWNWEIPSVTMEMPTGITKYNWFCYFLLDGKVHPFFKRYTKHLLSPPSTMFKSWARLVRRTNFLLQAVISKEIDSKAALYKAWEVDPKYLLKQYLQWLPEEKHEEVSRKWPQVS